MDISIKKLALLDLFDLLKYDWKEDAEVLKSVCYYTKSRVNNAKNSKDFELAYGMEQPFVLKAIAKQFWFF